MDWKPDFASETPLYLQIKAFIIHKISLGEWAVGTKIPSQRALAEQFGVNRSTVVTAISDLIAEGLLAGNTKGGTRVINNSWNLLTASPPPDWSSYVQAGTHYPNLPAIQHINRAEFQEGMIRLGTGELSPDLLPSERMKNIFAESSANPFTLGYEEPKGNLALRKQIAQYLQGNGIHTSSSNILIVSGALQALQLISMGLLQRGSAILLEKPSYLYSVHVFQSNSMKLVGLPMDEEGIQTSQIGRYKKGYNASILYTIPTFHNPTGTLMTEERRQALMQACTDEGLPIIEDDAYRELWFDEPPPLPLKARDPHALVLYLGTFSKTLSPGLRLGWVVAPEPVIERLADIKMQNDYGSSSVSQWAAAEWLGRGLYQEHLDEIRKQLKMRRDVAVQLLQTYFAGLAIWRVPAGGFYIWVQLTVDVPMQSLFERALKDGVLLNPGSIYNRHTGNYLRISYAYAKLHELEWGLKRVAILIRDLVGK
ncbi:PLP-dependent aminotransferase family protein [Paenibacillus aceris]|uniref:GntR family transcriptional regulator of abcA and norABC n=1 Tax=Paenibacillus aceris TaxID=869555 RepID=A0ABS4HTH0_9BACL|nr:PLP-dependent aminotransferase family protein [Paenibacillus aceris]MBP1961551.1 GntR family transcriptional regulator of abcA and norABC [Paenibacillus aceris]NHW37673.1 PLP-dependent aminotransferase family protein [Paenibacillus aceris]